MSRKFAVSAGTRYPTVEARRDARQGTYNRRYTAYRDLCAQLGLTGSVKTNWTSHYAELRGRQERVVTENAGLLAEESSPHRRFWLERFTLAEIRELAGLLT